MFGRKRVFLPLILLAVFLILVQSGLLLRWEIGAIRGYRRHLSPMIRGRIVCRYQPSCSQFAVARLQEDGFWLGNLEIGQRLLMCSPLGVAFDWVRGSL